MWPILPVLPSALQEPPIPAISVKAVDGAPAAAWNDDAQTQQVKKLDGLEVTYDSFTYDFETKRQVFSGKVTARYGPTILQADELTLDEETRQGEAKGKVVLTDPEGMVKAEALTFKWRRKTDPEPGPNDEIGRGQDVLIRAGNLYLKAASLTLFGDRWELRSAEGALTQNQKPEWKIISREVVIYPGSHGIARRVSLEALGVKLGPLSSYRFNLNPRFDTKFTIPSYSLDDRGRLGLSWGFARPLGDKAALAASWSAFPGSFASYQASYTFSELDISQTRARVGVASELGERFSGGYLDNIAITRPTQEDSEIRQRRRTWQISSQWNESPSGRIEGSALVSKPLDLTHELGGSISGAGWLSTNRLQVIRSSVHEEVRPRLVTQGALSLPIVHLADKLVWRNRLDYYGTGSDRTTFGFLRGQSGLVWTPDPRLTLGAAYVLGGEAGTPDFFWERLYSRQAVHWRIDANWGPLSLSYLWKYDFDQGVIYDREYIASYVAGVFEPFIEYRRFPSSYQFGVRFRMDNVVDRLISRSAKRGK